MKHRQDGHEVLGFRNQTIRRGMCRDRRQRITKPVSQPLASLIFGRKLAVEATTFGCPPQLKLRNHERDTSGTLAAVFSSKVLIYLASPTGFEPVLPP
jgi:hypothetical protein